MNKVRHKAALLNEVKPHQVRHEVVSNKHTVQYRWRLSINLLLNCLTAKAIGHFKVEFNVYILVCISGRSGSTSSLHLEPCTLLPNITCMNGMILSIKYYFMEICCVTLYEQNIWIIPVMCTYVVEFI